MRQIFLVSFIHYIRRLSRDIFGLLIFIALPVLLVFVLSTVASQNTEEQFIISGYNMLSSQVAIGMMLMFQLNGGIYLLNYLNQDLIKPMKWRLRVSPVHTYTLVFAATAACLVFTVIQGLFIVIITALFFDAYWGNIGITIMVIIIVSLISQFINFILFFLVRNLSTAEYLSWFISWSMAALGGVMFPLPDHSFFRFMKQYGTPIALGHNMIRGSGSLGSSDVNLMFNFVILLSVMILLAFAVIIIGNRKLDA